MIGRNGAWGRRRGTVSEGVGAVWESKGEGCGGEDKGGGGGQKPDSPVSAVTSPTLMSLRSRAWLSGSSEGHQLHLRVDVADLYLPNRVQ
ncbi:hypothetical protein E2C01_095821 [Portunus trituberculatus]|uniref:Uncharacterized protein n=1 Tax=Portunus trituberculatus TaxID=210409 RepID=A0A5B7K6P5_PORTR|nr:hypothetical protein [Portunus trituberculatus]